MSVNVKIILDQKGRNVVTVGPQVTLRQAARYLNEHHVGAVIVVEGNDRIVGILAERDLVSAIAKHGADCLEKPVSAFMWGNVYCCTEEMTVGSLMEKMTRLRARHLPVERDGRLSGIVSIGDVVRHHIEAIEREAEHIKAYIAG
ncbi:CBS domain-containing protein [Rhizobium sp. RU20A]|uniref:CBS domain-containing protein n=1 Tax=Rhizobium sp. RU20A TaxID=1907412 RepID=UPI000956E3D1|nr:CBS domain-containing protein [Rhizobium sp. RU20A]SIQ12529.1 CBS domain-containing protein [Rhizobium sp. RU20A]